MRKSAMVRLGIAAALATMGVAGAVGSGCTSSNSTSPGVDGGTDGATGTTGSTGATGAEGGTPEGGTGPGPDGGMKDGGGKDSAAPIPANLVIAHVGPGIPPVRVCFATGSGASFGVQPFNALPDNPSGAPPYPATGSFPAVAPGTPGIYPGTIGAFPTITDLAPLTITPFAILASSIANDINFDGGNGVNSADGGQEEDCVHLIGSHGLGSAEVAPAVAGRLTPGVDFFPLAPIPAGTLADQNTYLLTINGCLPGGEVSDAAAAAGFTCGPGDAGPSIGIAQLDTTTTAPDGGIAIQFAHRSVSLENTPIQPPGAPVMLHTPASLGVWPALIQPGVVGMVPIDAGPDGGDAGTMPVYGEVPVILGDAAAGPVTYNGTGITGTQILPLTETDPTTAFFGVFVQPLDGGAPNGNPWPGSYDPGTGAPIPGDLIALPLSVIDQLSSWGASTAPGGSPIGFVSGQSYTFIIIGDPVAEQLPNPDGGPGINPAWDGRGMHIVAFPNKFKPIVQ